MAVVVLSGPAAWADDGDTQSLAEGTRDPTADKPPTFSGYLQPQIGFVYRADAKPEDKWNYGAGGSQTGLVVAGAPAADWRYVVHLLVGAELLTAVSSVDGIDENGDNNVNEVDSTESTLPGYYLVADFHQPLSLTLDSRDQWQSTGPVTRSGHTPTGY